jgi:heme-degrading monooxygenase HmoA
MYGTIARLHPTAGRLDELIAYGRRMEDVSVPGFRSSYLFRPDKDPYDKPTVFLIALFDDEASYKANADSPDQHARYLELRALLEDDPEWMDGTFDGVEQR